MSCCGSNREALKTRRISVTPEPAPPAPTQVIYGGASSVLLRGPATGRTYFFTAAKPEQDVDPRDLPAILATGLFG